MGRYFFCLMLVGLLAPAALAGPGPTEWKARLDPPDPRAGEAAQVVVEATVEEPWHIYSMTPRETGPLPTTLTLNPGKALAAVGEAVQPKPRTEFDKGFKIDVEYFGKAVAFGIPVKVQPGAAGEQTASVKVRFMACKDGTCTRPLTTELPVKFTVAAGPARAEHQQSRTGPPTQPAGYEAPTATPPAAGTLGSTADQITREQKKGLLAFLLLALSSGFLALLTPCVFPMIPLTVSYFAKKREGAPGEGVRHALAYCIGIIVTFTGLGVLMSAVFGPTSLQKFATHPITNLALGILFVVMAINLFGGFEIQLPSWLTQKAHEGSKREGLGGTILMGFAFTVTSFTCTVAFVGTLLAAAASTGNYLYPTIGMLAFSTAFALPFFLLALFPQYLARMPKSGGWLVTVKAFLGFAELMAALKFLSNADLYWMAGILTRPVFLALWFAIAAVAGLYMLGLLRFPHDMGEKVGPVRAGIGVATLAAALWFLSGVNGTPLGWLVAFLPPPEYGSKMASAADHGGLSWTDDYDTAVQQAKAENKLMFLDFTGYQCSNCRVMEQDVFPRPEVKTELEKMVRVRLYTDGPDKQSQRYAQLQLDRFGQTTLPLYVVLGPDEQKLGESPFNTDVNAFVRFLREAQSRGDQVARAGQ